MTDKRGKQDRSRLEKRPYHSPQLYIYGDVNKLTRAKSWTMGTLDGKTIIWDLRS